MTIFKPGDRQAARRALGLPPTARIVLFAGHSAFKDMTAAQQALSGVQGVDLLFVGLGQHRQQGVASNQ